KRAPSIMGDEERSGLRAARRRTPSMTNAITSPGILSQGVSLEPREKRKLPVLPVAELLRSQATLTAVDRFARSKDGAHLTGAPAQAKYYRDLIPLEHPSPGEQYAFEVDLD